MAKIIRKYWILILIMVLAAFFYLFRLQETFVMAGDTSRDLIDALHIWQNKIITVVGEPVNTISNNPTQVLFGSLYLYLGIVGLLITNFNPAGSVLVDLVLTLSSIPFFYILSKKYLKKENYALISTFVYALSPVTIALTRSYWEPNIVIPISVFAWYFFLCKNSLKSFLIAGFITGIVFDIHYMNVIPLAFYIFLLFFQKDRKKALLSVSGFILAISPFFVFELRNNFYLLRAFMGTFGGFSTFSERTLNPFLGMDIIYYIFGLGPYQYFIPHLFNISFTIRIVISTIVGIAFIYFLLKKQKTFPLSIIGVLVVGILAGWFFERFHILALRYVLAAYPLFIISIIAFLTYFFKYWVLLAILPLLILSTKIITHRLDPNQREDYLPLRNIEEISKAIVMDDPQGKYNVTENILGDARSLSFRFYLMRDAKVKPQPVEIYDSIDTLYVISPSLEKTYAEDRWEFNASGPKKIVWEKNFGEFNLYKFTK